MTNHVSSPAGAHRTATPCTCFPHRQQSDTPAEPTTLWIPLHEMRQRWAAFAHDREESLALLATGRATLALAYEQSALFYYEQAKVQERLGYLHGMACSLDEVLDHLRVARQQWHACSQQVQELINQPRSIHNEEQDREVVRTLIHAVDDFCHRLGTLFQQVSQEQDVLARRLQEPRHQREEERG